MDLSDKLRRMGTIESSSQKVIPMTADPEMTIPGEVLENAGGSCYRVSRVWPLIEMHGQVALNVFTSASRHAFALAGKDARLDSLDLRDALFIDTETTGLAGGAGTVPFLIGLGWIEGNGFRVEQYFMRDYHEERAVLHAVRERAADKRWIVSYNGKSYDLNLLASRYILNRDRTPFAGLPHWDLLHAARRFWRLRLQDCSLGSIEKHILQFERKGDVPGFLIPQLYFDYLRDKQSARLEPVFTHNQWDILSLLALGGVLGRLVTSPGSLVSHGEDWLALARLYEDRSDWVMAEQAYSAALVTGIPERLEADVRWQRSLCLKRDDRWEEALELWRGLTRHSGLGLLPYEEAAKYFEHRQRDFEKARQTVLLALDRLNLRRDLGRDGRDGDAGDRLKYRLARLERKLGISSKANIDP